MQILQFTGPEQAGLGQREDPEIEPHQVKIRIAAGGICGGDIKNFINVRGRQLDAYPISVGGHEYAGVVEEVGAEVAGLTAGTRVARLFSDYCGKCLNCRLGMGQFCTGIPGGNISGGGFCTYSVDTYPEFGRGVYEMPEELSWSQGAIVEPAGCAIGIAFKAEAKPGDVVVVYGLGSIGHLTAQILCAFGCRVFGVDVMAGKLESAKPFCEWLVDGSAVNVRDKISEVTAGAGAEVVIEAIGAQATLEDSIEMCRQGGRLVLGGVHSHPVTDFKIERIFRKNLTVVPAKGAIPLVTADGVPYVFDYLKRGIINADRVATDFPYGDPQTAFRTVLNGGAVKAVLRQKL